jgi:transcriptional antiterminator NusG
LVSLNSPGFRTEKTSASRIEPENRQRWFVIYTMPRHEKFTARNFELREIECFLPAYEKVSLWRNRQKINVVLPLFPRYLFARFDSSKRLPVLETPGVQQIVGAGPTPVPLPDLEIEFLRQQIDKKVVEPYADLVVGNRVAIRKGPMTGIEGVLVHKQNGSRFIFTVHLIQKSVSIQIGAEDLEALES